MKRAFIIHGWDGAPDNAWIPWLKRELEKKGFKVIAPKMPTPNAPRINTWTAHLTKQVKRVDTDTYFVGHSIGCQTILRYLEKQKTPCGGVVCVGGWFLLTPEATPDAAYRRIAKPWLHNPINFSMAKKNAKIITAILSDNDPYVPLKENKTVFTKVLNAKVIIEKKKGHFDDDAKIKTLPSALKEIMIMAR